MVLSLLIHIFLIQEKLIIQKKCEFLYHYRHTSISSSVKQECSLTPLVLCQANFDVAWNKNFLSFQAFQNENINVIFFKKTLKQFNFLIWKKKSPIHYDQHEKFF